jgi:uncharacterized protein with ACT and thioredoxin-like domain
MKRSWHNLPDGVVIVLLNEPGYERLTEATCAFEAVESIREDRVVVERFELVFGKRIVIGGIGAAM